VVPICPELRALLVEAFEAAEPGATTIVPMAARQRVNLGTYLKRIILKAGHKPWPRLLQNLRASCATDWVEKYPAHVVAKWLGHSPKVAAQHYLMSKDRHFEDVVGGGRGEPLPGGAGQERPQKCDAKYDAIETRNATPQVTAGVCGVSHETTEPAATTRVTAGSSGIEPVVKTGEWRGQDSKKPGFTREKPGGEQSTNAKSNAVPPDLAEVAAVWYRLPVAVRLGIVAMVRAATD
jgi:hypothetical protein